MGIECNFCGGYNTHVRPIMCGICIMFWCGYLDTM
ncbi:hypothetical protein [Synechococcus phage S-B05]|nr:hypothetical protein [Synechococcus phage S-B05]